MGFLCALPPRTGRFAHHCPRCRSTLRHDSLLNSGLGFGALLAVLAMALAGVAVAHAHNASSLAKLPEADLGNLPPAGSLVRVSGDLLATRDPTVFLRREGAGPLAPELWFVFGFAIEEGGIRVPVDVSALHRTSWDRVVKSPRIDGSYRPGDRIGVAATVVSTSIGTVLRAERLAPEVEALGVVEPSPTFAAILSALVACPLILLSLRLRRKRLRTHALGADEFRKHVWLEVSARRRRRTRSGVAEGR